MTRGRRARRSGGRLGWFSLALALPQLAAPGAVARLVGLRETAATRAGMRAVGLQELAFAGGLLVRPRSVGLLRGRVGGDVAHLLLLARAARHRRNDAVRLRAAASAVAAVMVVDLMAARRALRAARSERDGLRARSRITVRRPAAEAYRCWRDLERLPQFMGHLESVVETGTRTSHWVARAPGGREVSWDAEIVADEPERLIAWRSLEGSRVDNAGVVRFAPAPGDGGTEVTVELEYRPPGGRAGAAVAKLLAEAPEQQVADALRRFKQVLETGEVVRSDGSPEGPLARRQITQRPARPAG